MRMMIREQSGARGEAVLLSANNQKMRMVRRSGADTVELTRSVDRWLTESGEAVEIEGILAIPGREPWDLYVSVRPRTLTAGQI